MRSSISNEDVKQKPGISDTPEHKPREPQMVTVNGQKVTHAHAYPAKDDSDKWFFTARLDGKQLKPQLMSKEDSEAYQCKEKNLTIQSLMERYYPTKLQEKVPNEAFRLPNVIIGNKGTLTVEKFNVYKEKDPESIDFGKWMFYAQIDSKKMSTPGRPELLNAYFDRTMTPGQIAIQAFGSKLHLRSYYERFRLPDTIGDVEIKISKDKEDGKWKISADFGEKGQTTKRSISFDDGTAFFKEHTASKEQLAAKYLLPEIKTLMTKSQDENIKTTIKR